MRTPLLLGAAAFALAPAAAAQTTLLSESFETDGNGSRYTLGSPEFTDGSSDYFIRTDGSNISTVSGPYTNIDGTFFFAFEDLDAVGDGNDQVNPKVITFEPIDASGFSDLSLSVLAGVGNEGGPDASNYDAADFVDFEFSFDGVNFQPCLAFRYFDNGNGVFNEPFGLDSNFDGEAEGDPLDTSLDAFTCGIGGAEDQSALTIRGTFSLDSGSEEFAFDLLEVSGVADDTGGGDADVTGTLAPGTCSFPRPSDTSRCFLMASGTNNLETAQRFTIFVVAEGPGGFSRVVKRGEVKLGPGESSMNKLSFRLRGSDPDGAYEAVLLAEAGSVAAPSAAAVELDRLDFDKGVGALTPKDLAGLRMNAALAAFPNPTTDAATLRFAVAETAEATLVVYDALGREVARPVAGAVEGPVEVSFDASALPAGLYVARLVVADRVETVRLSVVR